MLPVETIGVEHCGKSLVKEMYDRSCTTIDKKKNMLESIEAAKIPTMLKDSVKIKAEDSLDGEPKFNDTNKTQKFWAYRMDVSNINPENIKINLEGRDQVCIYVCNQSQGKILGKYDILDAKKTVFLPHGIDKYNISVYISNDGLLVIQAPYLQQNSTNSAETRNCSEKCVSCDKQRKRKHSIREKDQSEVMCVPMNGKRKPKELDYESHVNTKKMKLGANINELGDVANKPENCNKKTLQVEPPGRSNCQTQSCTRESMEFCKNSKDNENPTDSENTATGNKKVSDFNSLDIKCYSRFTERLVLLKIPVKEFFPELNKVKISVKDKTLTLKSERLVDIQGMKLSEVFLKEFSFPAHFDTSSLKLGRDIEGNVIISVKRTSEKPART